MGRLFKNWPEAALFIAALAGFTWNLGAYPLLDPDEGRNAEVMREMAASNNYLVPHLNTLPYLDKPPLYFAAGGLAVKAFGRAEWVVRMPSVLFTLATLLVLWLATRSWYDRGIRSVVIAVFAGAPLVLGFARTTIFDSALTLFVTTGILAFQRAVDQAPPRRREKETGAPRATTNYTEAWLTAGWTAMALGILTKGPVAAALVLLVTLPYAAWRKRLRALVAPLPLLVFLSILVPWLAAASRQVPDLISYAIKVETVERLFTPNLNRTGPWWYFFPILPAAVMQGALLTAFGFRTLLRNRADETLLWRRRLLFLWVIVPFVFFTLSQSKRPHYILPLIPAVALLAGQVMQYGNARKVLSHLGITLALIGLLLAGTSRLIPHLLTTTPRVEAAIPGVAMALGAVTLGAGVMLWLLQARINVAALLLVAPTAAIPFVSTPLMQAVGEDRSARPLARAMERVLTSDTEVLGIRAYPLSLPFYINREIVLATRDASELTSNYIRRNFARLSEANPQLQTASLWREALLTCNRPRIFISRRADAETRTFLAASLPLIIETRKFAVYGPCGVRSLALSAPVRGTGRR